MACDDEETPGSSFDDTVCPPQEPTLFTICGKLDKSYNFIYGLLIGLLLEPNDEDDTHRCDGYSAGSGLVWGNGTCHSPARPSPGLGNANAMKSRPTVGGEQVI